MTATVWPRTGLPVWPGWAGPGQTTRITTGSTIPGFPFKFSAFPKELDLDAPVLGEHNEEVLTRYLGRSQATIAALYEQGVLHKGNR